MPAYVSPNSRLHPDDLALPAAALAWGCLFLIAWVDLRRWEIDPCLCAGAALEAARIHIEDGISSAFAGAALGGLVGAAPRRHASSPAGPQARNRRRSGEFRPKTQTPVCLQKGEGKSSGSPP